MVGMFSLLLTESNTNSTRVTQTVKGNCLFLQPQPLEILILTDILKGTVPEIKDTYFLFTYTAIYLNEDVMYL